MNKTELFNLIYAKDNIRLQHNSNRSSTIESHSLQGEKQNFGKDESSESSSLFKLETIKTKYEETMAELELRKNKIKKKLEIYNIEGTENWDSFKHKLNHDLDELGKALNGFTTKP